MPRAANELTNEEVLRFYNNPELTNAQVVESLDTTWESLKTKCRVNRTLASQLTMIREGGVNGTHRPVAAEPASQVATEGVESQGRPVAERETSGVTLEQMAESTLPATTGSGEQIEFDVVIMGETHHIGPGTRDEAKIQVRDILAAVKLKNVMVEDANGNYINSFDEIRSGGRYMINKLSVAA